MRSRLRLRSSDEGVFGDHHNGFDQPVPEEDFHHHVMHETSGLELDC